jgi:hypothetical protein
MFNFFDLANPYVCAAALIIILIIILTIFVKSDNKISTVLQISLYFGIAAVIILDVHNSYLKNVYIDKDDDLLMDSVVKQATGGYNDYKPLGSDTFDSGLSSIYGY